MQPARPDWASSAFVPTRYTECLPDYTGNLYDRFAPVLDIVWRTTFGHSLDAFQAQSLRAITELTAFGTLRHRQFLVSMGRQNGKTELAAALALLFLLHNKRANIIGLASNGEQAMLVYDRVRDAIRANPALGTRFKAVTDTRGISTHAGGRYRIKPAKSDSLQGAPIDLGIIDEVHLLQAQLWDDMVNGMGGRPNCLVVGITTAGSEDSALLIHLYKLAAEGRIGHVICESSTDTISEDDDTLWAHLCEANPAYVVRPEFADNPHARAAIISDVRGQTPASAIRYRLNRFTASENRYMAVHQWATRAGRIEPPPNGIVFVIDRTPSWTHATISAAWRAGETFETQVVASIAAPTIDKLVDICVHLGPRGRLFAADSHSLGGLIEALKKRGLNTRKGTLGDATGAASRLYSHVAAGTIRHAGDPLLTVQLGHTSTKDVGDAYRLIRAGGDIDAVVATAGAVYFAELEQDTGVQIF